jgi:hypothetical protein
MPGSVRMLSSIMPGSERVKNGDLAQRVRALVFSARQCCRRSRVRAPVWPGTFLRRNIKILRLLCVVVQRRLQLIIHAMV